MTARVLNPNWISHPATRCAGLPCPLHAPSGHHMMDWPIYVRTDKHGLSERICPHGQGHPDPDSLAWLLLTRYDDPNMAVIHVHGCDGCCRQGSAPVAEWWDEVAGWDKVAEPEGYGVDGPWFTNARRVEYWQRLLYDGERPLMPRVWAFVRRLLRR